MPSTLGHPLILCFKTKFLFISVISDAKEGSLFMVCNLKDVFMYHHGHIRINVNPIQVLPGGHSDTV